MIPTLNQSKCLRVLRQWENATIKRQEPVLHEIGLDFVTDLGFSFEDITLLVLLCHAEGVQAVLGIVENLQIHVRLQVPKSDPPSLTKLRRRAHAGRLSGDVLLASRMHLHEDQVRSLVSHLTAWLRTGSFDLKGLPSSPPSSEDTELLDWLEERCLLEADLSSFVFPEIPNQGTTLRAAIRDARAKEAQASTTSQKGGQGV